jgi:uncharacterized protein YwgA
MQARKRETQKVADIVNDAGGKIVGRTKLQKLVYLLEVCGVGEGFEFEYRHYGPFSEALATAARNAAVIDLIDEEEVSTSWGGLYSIYKSRASVTPTSDQARRQIAQIAVEADPVELELAATAVFLKFKGFTDAWNETAKRKPEKSEAGRMKNARKLYNRLREVKAPKSLPDLG